MASLRDMPYKTMLFWKLLSIFCIEIGLGIAILLAPKHLSKTMKITSAGHMRLLIGAIVFVYSTLIEYSTTLMVSTVKTYMLMNGVTQNELDAIKSYGIASYLFNCISTRACNRCLQTGPQKCDVFTCYWSVKMLIIALAISSLPILNTVSTSQGQLPVYDGGIQQFYSVDNPDVYTPFLFDNFGANMLEDFVVIFNSTDFKRANVIEHNNNYTSFYTFIRATNRNFNQSQGYRANFEQTGVVTNYNITKDISPYVTNVNYSYTYSTPTHTTVLDLYVIENTQSILLLAGSQTRKTQNVNVSYNNFLFSLNLANMAGVYHFGNDSYDINTYSIENVDHGYDMMSKLNSYINHLIHDWIINSISEDMYILQLQLGLLNYQQEIMRVILSSFAFFVINRPDNSVIVSQASYRFTKNVDIDNSVILAIAIIMFTFSSVVVICTCTQISYLKINARPMNESTLLFNLCSDSMRIFDIEEFNKPDSTKYQKCLQNKEFMLEATNTNNPRRIYIKGKHEPTVVR